MARANRQPHPRDALSHDLRGGFLDYEEKLLESFEALRTRFRAERDKLQGKEEGGSEKPLRFFMHLDLVCELTAERLVVRWRAMQKIRSAKRIKAGDPKTWVAITIKTKGKGSAEIQHALIEALLPLHPNYVKDKEVRTRRRVRAGVTGKNSQRVRTPLTAEEYQQVEDLVLSIERDAALLRALWTEIKAQRRAIEKIYTLADRALHLLPQREEAQF